MTKFIRFFSFAIISAALCSTAFADVRVKARQTVSGQTTENTTFIKGKRSRTEQNIGGTQSVTLTQCDLKRGIQLNPQTQMYIISSWEDDTTTPSSTRVSGNTRTEVRKGGVVTTTTTIKDTGETKKMFGYTARHLIITTETEATADACTPMKKMKMVTDGWYIDAAFALDCDATSRGGYYNQTATGGCRDKYEAKTIGSGKRGYPVIEKMTMFDENGKESFSMTNEVVELATATLDAALFEIPNGWREAKDQQSMYTAATVSLPVNTTSSDNSGLGSTVRQMSSPSPSSNADVGPKKSGTVRIGLAGVKTGAVGEGMNASELAAAVKNSFGEYLKGTNVEVVSLEAKLAAAVESEAKTKDCDFVLYLTVSHKKGGGGFGFGKALGMVVSQTGIGGTGSVAGNVAGQVATRSIVAATSNIKAKDELSLDVSLVKSGTSALTKQFKTKAKSAGEDIISPLMEQAATAIVATAGK